jgi:hypothetical protein
MVTAVAAAAAVAAVVMAVAAKAAAAAVAAMVTAVAAKVAAAAAKVAAPIATATAAAAAAVEVHRHKPVLWKPSLQPKALNQVPRHVQGSFFFARTAGSFAQRLERGHNRL